MLFYLLSLSSAINAIFHTDQMQQFWPAVLHLALPVLSSFCKITQMFVVNMLVFLIWFILYWLCHSGRVDNLLFFSSLLYDYRRFLNIVLWRTNMLLHTSILQKWCKLIFPALNRDPAKVSAKWPLNSFICVTEAQSDSHEMEELRLRKDFSYIFPLLLSSLSEDQVDPKR